jgi:hypothetical protein
MEKLALTIPTLFGDHHTTAVRNMLLQLPGVKDVTVRTAARVVEIDFDPKETVPESIESALAEQGYESDGQDLAYATSIRERRTRHTAAHEGVGDTLSFAERGPSFEGRALWPCPGFDPKPTMDEG